MGEYLKKKTPYDWVYEHTENLKKKRDLLINSSANDYIEKNINKIGYNPGYWTILKNITLAYVINPFGKILKSSKYVNTVLIDLFCGSGITILKDNHKKESNDLNWIPGSPIISMTMTDFPFSNYYFSDKNSYYLSLLNDILSSYERDFGLSSRYKILEPKDANENFFNIIPEIKSQYVFAYIDPTGFQWKWDSMMELLSFKNFDILLNHQTRESDRIPENTIEGYFGPCSGAVIHNCNNCDEKLNEYIRQIENMGCYVTSIKIGKDRSNQYYYHILHISKRDSYKSIINSLKEKIEIFDGHSINQVWNDLHGISRQKAIEDY